MPGFIWSIRGEQRLSALLCAQPPLTFMKLLMCGVEAVTPGNMRSSCEPACGTEIGVTTMELLPRSAWHADGGAESPRPTAKAVGGAGLSPRIPGGMWRGAGLTPASPSPRQVACGGVRPEPSCCPDGCREDHAPASDFPVGPRPCRRGRRGQTAPGRG